MTTWYDVLNIGVMSTSCDDKPPYLPVRYNGAHKLHLYCEVGER